MEDLLSVSLWDSTHGAEQTAGTAICMAGVQYDGPKA